MSRRRLILAAIGVTAVAAIVAVVVVLFATGDGGPTAEEARITVEEVINQVETDRSQGPGGQTTAFLPAQVGQELLSGDGVKTFRNSQARVDIVVRTFTRITRTTPNTIWRLGQFAVNQDTVIELTQGKIFLIDVGLEEGQQPVQIVTPAGTASPRGTWMSVEYDPEAGITEVQCFRGTCQLENDLGIQVLTDEEKSTVTASEAPAEPVLLSQQDKTVFEALPEAESGEVPVPTPEIVPPTPTPTPPMTSTLVTTPATAPPAGTITPAPVPTATAAAVVATPIPQPTSTAAPLPTVVPDGDDNSSPGQAAAPPSEPEPTSEPVTPVAPTAVPAATSTPVPPATSTPIPTATPTLTPTPSPTATPPPAPLPDKNVLVLPHVFTGNATIDGAPAPEGTTVTVWLQKFAEPIGQGVFSSGQYTVLAEQYGNSSFNGRTITFKLDGLVAQQTAVFDSGEGTILDLTAASS